jgi:hypothetical protein
MDHTWAMWWKKEIERKSKSLRDYITYTLLIFFIVLLIFSCFGQYVKAYLPNGGALLIFKIPEHMAKLVSFMADIMGIITGAIGISLLSLWKLREPRFTRYIKTAESIIDGLAKRGRISDNIRQSMLAVASKELTPCTDRNKKEQCEEGVLRVCCRLAEFASQSVAVEKIFDLKRFKSDLDALERIPDKETMQKFLENLRNRVHSELPYEPLANEIRKEIYRLIDFLNLKISEKDFTQRCLDFLLVLLLRRDNKIQARISKIFLDKIEAMYPTLNTEQKCYALSILQRIHNYDYEYLRKLIEDAIEKWSDEEFAKLYRNISVNEIEKTSIRKLEHELWNLRSKAAKCQDKTKIKRIDAFLDMLR